MFEILRDPDERGAVVAQPAEHVHTYYVERHQIREIEPERTSRFRADTPQLAHLGLREPPGEVDGATVGHLHHPNSALHGVMRGKTDTNIGAGCVHKNVAATGSKRCVRAYWTEGEGVRHCRL